ncbi:MAG: helix-turn-helix domain-containing protein [Candidatus Omnitrophota bacterium]
MIRHQTKYKFWIKSITIAVLCLFVVNDFVFAINTIKERMPKYTLAPVSRLSPMVTITGTGKDLSIVEEFSDISNLAEEFKKDISFSYITQLISQVLTDYGVKITAQGLIKLISQDLAHIDFKKYRFDGLYQDEEVFYLPCCLSCMGKEWENKIYLRYYPKKYKPQGSFDEYKVLKTIDLKSEEIICEVCCLKKDNPEILQKFVLENPQKKPEDKKNDMIDTRPVKANLLHELYVEHDMAVKEIINLENKLLTAVYGGAGADISNFLLSTNAQKGYFISQYKNFWSELSAQDLKECFESLSAEAYIKKYCSKWYSKSKYHDGYGTAAFIWTNWQIIAALALELKAIGVDLSTVKVIKEKGCPAIQFKWNYSGAEEKEYKIIFVNADITRPEEYQDILKDEKIDIYYQRAGLEIAKNYKKKTKSFINFINQCMRKDGYYVTDDNIWSSFWFIKAKTPPFPVKAKEIKTPRIIDMDKKVLKLRKWCFLAADNIKAYGVCVNIRKKLDTENEQDINNNIDQRLVKAGLLHELYVEHDMAVKEIVNPDNKPLTVVYGGAGADISNFLLSTNAIKAFFVDKVEIDIERIQKLKYESWDKLEQLIEQVKTEEGESYRAYKERFGYGITWGETEEEKKDLELLILFELKAIGVNKNSIRIRNNKGFPEIKFKWTYLNGVQKQYSITFINTAIDEPEKYPKLLQDVLKKKIDIYYQRAGNYIASNYEKFLPLIASKLKAGGFLITDDFLPIGTSGSFLKKLVQKHLKDMYIANPDLLLADKERSIFTQKDEMKNDRIKQAERKIIEDRQRYVKDSSGNFSHYGWDVHLRQKIRSVNTVKPPPGTPATLLKYMYDNKIFKDNAKTAMDMAGQRGGKDSLSTIYYELNVLRRVGLAIKSGTRYYLREEAIEMLPETIINENPELNIAYPSEQEKTRMKERLKTGFSPKTKIDFLRNQGFIGPKDIMNEFGRKRKKGEQQFLWDDVTDPAKLFMINKLAGSFGIQPGELTVGHFMKNREVFNGKNIRSLINWFDAKSGCNGSYKEALKKLKQYFKIQDLIDRQIQTSELLRLIRQGRAKEGINIWERSIKSAKLFVLQIVSAKRRKKIEQLNVYDIRGGLACFKGNGVSGIIDWAMRKFYCKNSSGVGVHRLKKYLGKQDKVPPHPVLCLFCTDWEEAIKSGVLSCKTLAEEVRAVDLKVRESFNGEDEPHYNAEYFSTVRILEKKDFILPVLKQWSGAKNKIGIESLMRIYCRQIRPILYGLDEKKKSGCDSIDVPSRNLVSEKPVPDKQENKIIFRGIGKNEDMDYTNLFRDLDAETRALGWPLARRQRYLTLLASINSLESRMKELTERELQAKTKEFKARLDLEETLDDLLPEAFAVVRETARRVINERPHDIQILAGIAMHEAKGIEMDSSQGKTLTAMMPAYLNALTERGVQIHTTNNYLAKRDADYIGRIFDFLGLTSGAITSKGSFLFKKEGNPRTTSKIRNLCVLPHKNQEEIRVSKRRIYNTDVVYGWAREIVFDKLKDDLADGRGNLVQRNLAPELIIVDEADSLLIDENKDMLVLAAQNKNFFERRFFELIYDFSGRYIPKIDYSVDIYERTVSLTGTGKVLIEELLLESPALKKIDREYLVLLMEKALEIQFYAKDEDYTVCSGKKVVIVDKYSGRLKDGNVWEHGVQQFIEKQEKTVLHEMIFSVHEMTYKNYYGHQEKIAPMSATLLSEEEEISANYGVEIVKMPLRVESRRENLYPLVFLTKEEKRAAICKDVLAMQKKRRPVLIGVSTIREAENIKKILNKAGIFPEILDGRNETIESSIIERAGQCSGVTIVTPAGARGVHIRLGQGVSARGGLHAIGGVFYENKRMEDQFNKRAARGGDPGSSRNYISLDEENIRIFGGDDRKKLKQALKNLEQLGLSQEEAILSSEGREIIRNIQHLLGRIRKRQEDYVRRSRERFLKYDDIIDPFRECFFSFRRSILELEDEGERRKTLKLIDDLWIRCQLDLSRLKGRVDIKKYEKIVNMKFDKIADCIKNNCKIIPAPKQNIPGGENIELMEQMAFSPETQNIYIHKNSILIKEYEFMFEAGEKQLKEQVLLISDFMGGNIPKINLMELIKRKQERIEKAIIARAILQTESDRETAELLNCEERFGYNKRKQYGWDRKEWHKIIEYSEGVPYVPFLGIDLKKILKEVRETLGQYLVKGALFWTTGDKTKALEKLGVNIDTGKEITELLAKYRGDKQYVAQKLHITKNQLNLCLQETKEVLGWLEDVCALEVPEEPKTCVFEDIRGYSYQNDLKCGFIQSKTGKAPEALGKIRKEQREKLSPVNIPDSEDLVNYIQTKIDLFPQSFLQTNLPEWITMQVSVCRREFNGALERIKNNKIFSFKALIYDDEDYALGYGDEEEIGIAEELLGLEKPLLAEYLFHEAICFKVGHKKARELQSFLFPENYSTTDAGIRKSKLQEELRAVIKKKVDSKEPESKKEEADALEEKGIEQEEKFTGIRFLKDRILIIKKDFRFSLQTPRVKDALSRMHNFMRKKLPSIDMNQLIKKIKEEIEKPLIAGAFVQTKGKKCQAIELLDMYSAEFHNKFQKYNFLDTELLREYAKNVPVIPAEGIELKKIIKEAVNKLEKHLIVRTLKQTKGHRSETAKRLKVSLAGLWYKINQLFEENDGISKVSTGTKRREDMPVDTEPAIEVSDSLSGDKLEAGGQVEDVVTSKKPAWAGFKGLSLKEMDEIIAIINRNAHLKQAAAKLGMSHYKLGTKIQEIRESALVREDKRRIESLDRALVFLPSYTNRLLNALKKTNGNQTMAAQRLGQQPAYISMMLKTAKKAIINKGNGYLFAKYDQLPVSKRGKGRKKKEEGIMPHINKAEAIVETTTTEDNIPEEKIEPKTIENLRDAGELHSDTEETKDREAVIDAAIEEITTTEDNSLKENIEPKTDVQETEEMQETQTIAEPVLQEEEQVQVEDIELPENKEILQKVKDLGWDNKTIVRYLGQLNRINELEKDIQALSDKELALKTQEFKLKLKDKTTLDDILLEAFAVVRETAWRVIGKKPYDEQILAGIAIHEGKAVEMISGEGKTLAAIMPAYLNALTEKGVHIHTVNDYLAKRDANLMGQVFDFLGLRTGVIVQGKSYLFDKQLKRTREEDFNFLRQSNRAIMMTKKDAYEADIVYGYNRELAFDHLRDNLIHKATARVNGRSPVLTIVDEGDSILIDENIEPLVISIPRTDNLLKYIFREVYKFSKNLVYGIDYEINSLEKIAILTEKGKERIKDYIKENQYLSNMDIYLLIDFTENAIASELYVKDVDYVVEKNNAGEQEIVAYDEISGKLKSQSVWEKGLQQFIELKEDCILTAVSPVVIAICYKNYYSKMEKLSAMSGTFESVAQEAKKYYGLEFLKIPMRNESQRKDLPDIIVATDKEKWTLIINDICEKYTKGQPVYVGTRSIKEAKWLKEQVQKKGIHANVFDGLDPRNEERIIGDAGRPGAVTITTQIGGRGVDIEVPGVSVRRGGLYVIGSGLYKDKRVKGQLRFRTGRNGQVGSTVFYVSLEEEDIVLFGEEELINLKKEVDSLTKMSRKERTGRDDVRRDILKKQIKQRVETIQKQMQEYRFNMREYAIQIDDRLDYKRRFFYCMKNMNSQRHNSDKGLIRLNSLWASYFSNIWPTRNRISKAKNIQEDIFDKGFQQMIRKIKQVPSLYEELWDVNVPSGFYDLLKDINREQKTQEIGIFEKGEREFDLINKTCGFKFSIGQSGYGNTVELLKNRMHGIKLRDFITAITQETEKFLILKGLAETGGKKESVAKLLKMGINTLTDRIQKYHLEKSESLKKNIRNNAGLLFENKHFYQRVKSIVEESENCLIMCVLREQDFDVKKTAKILDVSLGYIIFKVLEINAKIEFKKNLYCDMTEKTEEENEEMPVVSGSFSQKDVAYKIVIQNNGLNIEGKDFNMTISTPRIKQCLLSIANFAKGREAQINLMEIKEEIGNELMKSIFCKTKENNMHSFDIAQLTEEEGNELKRRIEIDGLSSLQGAKEYTRNVFVVFKGKIDLLGRKEDITTAIEKYVIVQALKMAQGEKELAARKLLIPETVLYPKIEQIMTPGTLDKTTVSIEYDFTDPELFKEAKERENLAIERQIRDFSKGEKDTIDLNELKGLMKREINFAMVSWALKQSGGNKAKAAELLGVSKRTLWNKTEEQNLGYADIQELDAVRAVETSDKTITLIERVRKTNQKLEEYLMVQALILTKGNKQEAARKLGISRRTLYDYLERSNKREDYAPKSFCCMKQDIELDKLLKEIRCYFRAREQEELLVDSNMLKKEWLKEEKMEESVAFFLSFFSEGMVDIVNEIRQFEMNAIENIDLTKLIQRIANEIEAMIISEILHKTKGHRTKTAELLEVSRRTLYERMEQCKLLYPERTAQYAEKAKWGKDVHVKLKDVRAKIDDKMKEYLSRVALLKTKRNRTAAACCLGISKRTLYDYLIEINSARGDKEYSLAFVKEFKSLPVLLEEILQCLTKPCSLEKNIFREEMDSLVGHAKPEKKDILTIDEAYQYVAKATENIDTDKSMAITEEILKYPINDILVVGTGLIGMSFLLALMDKQVTFVDPCVDKVRDMERWAQAIEQQTGQPLNIQFVCASIDEINEQKYDLITLIDFEENALGVEFDKALSKAREILRERAYLVIDSNYNGKGIKVLEDYFKTWQMSGNNKFYEGRISKYAKNRIVLVENPEVAEPEKEIFEQEQNSAGKDFFDELIIQAIKAKRRREKILIAIDISWIPEMHQSFMQGVLNQLARIYRKKGLDNVLIHRRPDAERTIKMIKDTIFYEDIKLSNVIAVTGKETIESGFFNEIRSSENEKKALLLGISNKDLNGEIDLEDMVNYIGILEMLTGALKLVSCKKEPESIEIPGVGEFKRITPRTWVVFPKERRLVEEVKKEYKTQKKHIKSAA